MAEKTTKLWTEISLKPQSERWKLLADILNKEGIKNQYQAFATTQDNFNEKLIEATEKFFALRVGPPFGELVTHHFFYESAITMSLGAADTLIPSHGKWWTRSCLFQAFHYLFSDRGESFNVQSTALVVGAGAAARVVISVLIKIGYKHIKITNRFRDQAFNLIADLKKSYFGVHFEFVSVSQLTLLLGTNSVMVNTTPCAPGNELTKELMYFNFLEPGGEIWDLTFSPADTELILEAEQIGAKVVRGFEVASWADVVWVEWAFGHRMDQQIYVRAMEKMLRKHGGDP